MDDIKQITIVINKKEDLSKVTFFNAEGQTTTITSGSDIVETFLHVMEQIDALGSRNFSILENHDISKLVLLFRQQLMAFGRLTDFVSQEFYENEDFTVDN